MTNVKDFIVAVVVATLLGALVGFVGDLLGVPLVVLVIIAIALGAVVGLYDRR